MQKEYRSVVFDSENKKYEIKDGTIGIYPFGDGNVPLRYQQQIAA